ncbi:MAG: hypothetical protein WA414_13540 [Acidobacteriaceae bacterium]
MSAAEDFGPLSEIARASGAKLDAEWAGWARWPHPLLPARRAATTNPVQAWGGAVVRPNAGQVCGI